jgi:hypothetical protein
MAEVRGLTISDFFAMSEQAVDAERDESKARMTEQGFTAWQITETVKGLMYGSDYKPMSFNTYLGHYGLMDGVEVPASKPISAEDALKIAEEIARIDRIAQEGGRDDGS